MTLDRFRIEGKVALVTGGNRGIGLAIAKLFGEADAHVMISGCTSAIDDLCQSDRYGLARRGVTEPVEDQYRHDEEILHHTRYQNSHLFCTDRPTHLVHVAQVPMIGTAFATKSDLSASNGILHLMDGVLQAAF